MKKERSVRNVRRRNSFVPELFFSWLERNTSKREDTKRGKEREISETQIRKKESMSRQISLIPEI